MPNYKSVLEVKIYNFENREILNIIKINLIGD